MVATSGMLSRVGQGDQAGLDGGLDRQAVAVQFLDGAAGEGFGQGVEQAFGFGLLAVGEQAGDRAGGAAGQQEQAGGVLGDALERELRLQARVGFEEAERRQALQIGEAGGVLGQQDDRVGRQAGVVGVGRSASWQPMIGWMPLPAQYWQNSRAPNRLPVSVMATAGMFSRLRQGGDLVRSDRALAERVGGMGAEVDEIGVGHAGRVSEAVESGQGPVRVFGCVW